MDHGLVEGEVGLRSEDPVGDENTLDLGMLARSPYLDLGAGRKEAIGRLGCRWRNDVVLVHLVKVNFTCLILEEELASLCEIYPAVAQLPFSFGLWLDFGSEKPTEQLMAETNAAEFDIWAAGIQFWLELENSLPFRE